MSRSKALGWSLVAWLAVGVFWLVTTRGHHPTWTLAVIVTASLMIAYAGTVYINHLVLIPRYWRTGRYTWFAGSLLGTMAVLTALALTVIRVSYHTMLGPDPDPNGLYIHYAIDFFGMAVHVLGAAGVVWAVGRLTRPRTGERSSPDAIS